MRKLLLAGIVLSLALAGCVQMKMDTVIKDSGAGTLDIVYSLSPSAAEAIKELQALPDAGGQVEMPELFGRDRAALEKECAESGVTLRKYETATVNGRQQVTVGMDFKEPSRMGVALGSGGGGIGLYKTKDGNYWLRTVSGQDVAGKTAKEMGDEAAEGVDEGKETPDKMPSQEQMAKVMAAMGKLMQAAAELNVVMRVTVPGDIIEHNATRVEGRTAIWEITSENMMEAKGEPEVLFSGKGLNIAAPLWKGEDKAE